MKFGVDSRANTPYPFISGVTKWLTGAKSRVMENLILILSGVETSKHNRLGRFTIDT